MLLISVDQGLSETNEIKKMFKVGDVYQHNEYEILIEKNTEWKKYRVQSKKLGGATFVTIKNDTIVSIWRRK